MKTIILLCSAGLMTACAVPVPIAGPTVVETQRVEVPGPTQTVPGPTRTIEVPGPTKTVTAQPQTQGDTIQPNSMALLEYAWSSLDGSTQSKMCGWFNTDKGIFWQAWVQSSSDNPGSGLENLSQQQVFSFFERKC